MKKKLFAALSALTLTDSLLAAPVSAAVKVPRVYRYYALGAMQNLLYDAKNNAWYNEKGELLPIPQKDRQEVRCCGKTYIADFAEMKVYDTDGTEVPGLTYFLGETVRQAQKSVVFREGNPDGAAMPVMLHAMADSDNFGFIISGGASGMTQLAKMSADADMTFQNTEDWQVMCAVDCSTGSLEQYTDTGDANLDGAFTIADTVILARAAAEDETLTVSELGLVLADMDGDGELTVLDVTQSLQRLAYGDETAPAQLTWKDLHALWRENVTYSDFDGYAYTQSSGELEGLPKYTYPIDNGWTLTMIDTSVMDKTKTKDDMVREAVLTDPAGTQYLFLSDQIPWDAFMKTE